VNELRDWIERRLQLNGKQGTLLLTAIDEVVRHQRELWQESKNEAVQAVALGFAEKISGLQRELESRDATVSSVARYFEEVVADLTEKSHRDPKTKLLNFAWFMERLESFLAVEQRVRWCAVGVVDITQFKWYNDTLGHATGDRIIERVAAILAEQIRSADLLALERSANRVARDLHARFGGDEFCFLIPDLPGPDEAVDIATRFKRAVEGDHWPLEDPGLAQRPVIVDVGIVCLWLGPVSERRGVARKLAEDLIKQADRLMYDAKGQAAEDVHRMTVKVSHGDIVPAHDTRRERRHHVTA
jgi:diguanylate cyclase (GGDEF)-like protein